MKSLTRKRTMLIAAALLAVPLMTTDVMAQSGRRDRSNNESGHHRAQQRDNHNHSGAHINFAGHNDHNRRYWRHHRGHYNGHRHHRPRHHYYRPVRRVYVPTYTAPCAPVYRPPVRRHHSHSDSGFSISLFFRD